MPVVRVDNYLDAYRVRAQSDDLHEMAGRSNKKAETEFANRRILEFMKLKGDDVVVDIGCGDASLLRMAAGSAQACVGIASTIEEKKRLESAFPRLRFLAASAQELPLDSRSASKIVCNAVLILIPSEMDVQASLREMVRIARPGATIWIGEVTEIDEYARYGMYRGTSMLGLLWHLLRHTGVRSFLGMIRRLAKAFIGNEQIVLNSAGLFYASPQKMISLAEGCGLRLQTYFRHKGLNEQGKIVDSEFRYDYIFTV